MVKHEGPEFVISCNKLNNRYEVLVEDKINHNTAYRTFDEKVQARYHYYRMVAYFGSLKVSR